MSDKPGLTRRLAAAWTEVCIRRPTATVAVFLTVTALSGWLGSGLGVKSQLEDLFPEHTPAVQAARRAREILPSLNQMQVVIGSPSREANRALATELCEAVGKLPEIAAVECRRDIQFFEKNGALWLSTEELERIDERVRVAIRDATGRELLGDALTEGLEGTDDGGAAGDDFEDDFEDDFDEGDKPATRPTAAVPKAAAPKMDAPKGGDGPDAKAKGDAPADAPRKSGLHVPDDVEIREKIGVSADLREWVESPDGTVLGVKFFPKVDAGDVDASKAFVAKMDALIAKIDPTRHHKEMKIVVKGDYASMTRQVDSIRHGLVVTSIIALAGIIFLQLLAFRRLRALILLFVPLIVGIALTVGFARVAVGYLNIITAFIFGILFGLGNDFGVYTLSRYMEGRSEGHTPEGSLRAMMPGLWGALGTAAATTAGGFLALTLFEFRGFSQFGLIAGVGVLLALVATLGILPPLALVLHRIWPEKDVSPDSTRGLRVFGLVARRTPARVVVFVLLAASVFGVLQGQHLDFNTDFRRLRNRTAEETDSPKQLTEAEKKAQADADLSHRFGNEAVQKDVSPILVVADNMEDAAIVHAQIEAGKARMTRLHHFVSVHTFVPHGQAEKLPIIARIRERIEKKRHALNEEDGAEADKALARLQAQAFTADDLPDFIRKRFLDVDGHLGRFLLLYPNGNLADARKVREVIDQMGQFHVGERTYLATASYFMLAEADGVVREEGPLAVLAAALAVLLITWFHFRRIRPVLYAFVPLALGFCIFLGAAYLFDLELNLFSVTVLPSVFGIGIDGTVHIVHRAWGLQRRGDLAVALSQVGGAALLAALTTMVGFGALLFQDNRGVQTLGLMAVVGIAVVCTGANLLAGGMLALTPGMRDDPEDPGEKQAG